MTAERRNETWPPKRPWDAGPAVSAAQMAVVDELAVGQFGLSLLQMMENAGRTLALLASHLWAPTTVTVLAGPGGNGGGGLTAARHLANHGVTVAVALSKAHSLTTASAHQLHTLDVMGVPVHRTPPPADVVIDALVGYGLTGNPRGQVAELVEWANEQPTVLALDVPSGLDATTGDASTPCVSAAATMTLALPKTGLLGPEQPGRLFLADIGIPMALYARMGLSSEPVFTTGEVLELRAPDNAAAARRQ